jgi:hypothetical protein
MTGEVRMHWPLNEAQTGALVLLAGLSGTALALSYMGGRGVRDRRWPRVDGKVTRAMPVSRGDGDYHVHMHFRYGVGDQIYCGREDLLPPDTTEAGAAAFVAAHPADSTIPVWFDPHQPSAAVLTPGVASKPVWLLAVSLALLAYGVYLLLDAPQLVLKCLGS